MNVFQGQAPPGHIGTTAASASKDAAHRHAVNVDRHPPPGHIAQDT